MLKSPSKETLWDSAERKSPEEAPPWIITWRSLLSRSDATAAKSNSEKNGPCSTVFTQCTAHSFDSCTSWYNIPPLLAPSISLYFSKPFLADQNDETQSLENSKTLNSEKSIYFCVSVCVFSLSLSLSLSPSLCVYIEDDEGKRSEEYRLFKSLARTLWVTTCKELSATCLKN